MIKEKGPNFYGKEWHYIDRQWHHMIGVTDMDANRVKIYVDGIEQPDEVVLPKWFGGIIDDVAIHHRALPADEVARMYEEMRGLGG